MVSIELSYDHLLHISCDVSSHGSTKQMTSLSRVHSRIGHTPQSIGFQSFIFTLFFVFVFVFVFVSPPMPSTTTTTTTPLHNHLYRALKRIRHEWHTTTTNHKRLSNRLSIVSVHLKQLQTEHQLSNTAMKHLLRSQGVNLVTGKAHGRQTLKKMLRSARFRVKVKDAKLAGEAKWCLEMV